MENLYDEKTKPVLTSWDDWERFARSGERTRWSSAVYGFKSRWQLGQSLHSLNLVGYARGSNVPYAYQALLKVDIVCTAAEQLARAMYYPTPARQCYLVVEDERTAQKIREALDINPESQFIENLLREAEGKSPKFLQAFCNGVSNDLMHLMRPLRNGVSHGTSTPSGLRIGGNGQRELSRIEAIFDLCQAVLDDCDRQFTEFVGSLEWSQTRFNESAVR